MTIRKWVVNGFWKNISVRISIRVIVAEVCIKLAIYRSLNLKQIMQNGSEDQVELTMNNIVVLSVKITSRSTCINSNYVILSVEIIYITHTQTSRIKNSGFVQRSDQLSPDQLSFCYLEN